MLDDIDGPDPWRRLTAIYIIDRVKHWSSRAWLAVNSAAAFQRQGGRSIVAVDMNEGEEWRARLLNKTRMKPDLIIDHARREGLDEFQTFEFGGKHPYVYTPRYWRAVARLARVVEEESVDVLHVFRRTHILTACAVASISKRPVAVVTTCPRSDRTLRNRFPHVLLHRRLDAVISFSQQMAQANKRVRGVAPAISHEVPAGLPPIFTDVVHPREPARRALCRMAGVDGAPLIGMLGDVEHEKCNHNLVYAAGMLREKLPGLRVLIIGDAIKKAASKYDLHRIIDEEGLEDIVRMMPPVPADQVPRVIAGLDIALYLSCRSSGPSRSMLEYCSQGTPTVATDVGAVPEYHRRDRRAFRMIPFKQVPPVAEAVEDIWRNPSMRTEMSRRGRALVMNHFTFDLLGWRLRTIYEGCLRRRGIPAPGAVAAGRLRA